MKFISTKTAALVLLGLFCVFIIAKRFPLDESSAPSPVSPPVERIPAGIIVTESSSVSAPPDPAINAPGDAILADYGRSDLAPQNDVLLIARAISNFLIIQKQATDRPLSANEEWSAALRGQRPGTERWISDNSVIFDSKQRLIDRWNTPLHFHALGDKRWEIRSAGPDRKLWTPDDLLEKTSG
jgi:hypothetical protein